MSIHTAKPEHEIAYQELAALMKRCTDRYKLSSEELLAVAANMLGKVIAQLQDQRTMTKERAMAIVCANLEMGNQHVIGELLGKSEGSS
jgi:hypothetical protein